MTDLEEILKSQVASIKIDKVLTLIKPIDKNKTLVQQYPLKDYEKIISQLKNFKIYGNSKPGKIKKYIDLSEKKGFKIDKKSTKNAGFEGTNSDVLNYFILFKK